VYEDEAEENWFAADDGRVDSLYGGLTSPPMWYKDDSFGSAMGGFGGDGLYDPDELWDEMRGRMDEIFGGMSLGGGYGGRRGSGAGGGYGYR
jgi:hypothetical protein